MMFDGTDDYVNVGTNSALNIYNSPLTLEAWINTNSEGYYAIMQRMENAMGSSGYSLELNNDGTVSSYYYYGGSGPTLTSNTKVTDGKWHHIVATFSSTQYSLFIDGVLDKQASGSYPTSGSSYSLDFNIGKYTEAPSGYFKGIIDTARVYTRALTESEILSNYQSGNIEMRYRTSDDGSTWSDWYGGTEESVEDFNNEYLYDTDDNGLVAYYPMDESSGTSVEDVSSNTNDGTASGTTIVDGKYGNSRGFDGVDDYIQIPDNSSIQLTNKISVELWVKPPAGQTAQRAIHKLQTASGQLSFTLHPDTESPIWGVEDTSGDMSRVDSGISLIPNRWNHIVGTFDGTDRKIYINGVNATISTASIITNTGTSTDLFIGKRADGGQFFEGELDSLRIYSKVLSSSEIHNQWLEGSSNPSSLGTKSISNSIEGDNALSIESNGSNIDNNTVGYWKLDEDVSADINDGYPSYSGWSNTATSTCGSYTMMGGYNTFAAGDYTEKTISNLPAGTYMVAFNYYHIDSWDGESGRAFWNGNQIWSRAHTHGGNQVCGGSWGDSNGLNYDMVYVTVNHTGGNATLRFDSTLDQGGTDESWGVDNISVSDFNINDESPYANDGATMGSTTYRDGRSGRARDFDGSNDHVIIDTNFGVGTSNTSIEAWIYLESTSSSGGVVKIGADGSYGFGVGVGNTEWHNDGNNLIILFEGIRWVRTGVPVGTGWHHFTMILDSNGYPSAYLDGEMVYSDSIGPPTVPALNKTSIGGYSRSGDDRYFDGFIDEVRISNVARTPEEILESYNLGKNKYISKSIDTTDISSNTTLPFWIASDEIGSNMDLMYGESAYANYEPDENTVGYWSMDKEGPESQVSDLSGNGLWISPYNTCSSNQLF